MDDEAVEKFAGKSVRKRAFVLGKSVGHKLRVLAQQNDVPITTVYQTFADSIIQYFKEYQDSIEKNQ